MTNSVRLPDGPVIEGSYPDGSSWRAVELDNGRARVVIYSSEPSRLSLMVKDINGFKSLGYTSQIETLLTALLKKDRAAYKETMSWFDSHFTEEELKYAVSNNYDYSYSDKSWMYLITLVKFKSLGYFKRWFEEQSDTCWIDDGYALQILNTDNSVERLRLYYEDDNTSAIVSYSHRSYYKENLARETWRINSIEELRRLLETESKTTRAFRRLKNFDILKRGLDDSPAS